MCAEKLGHTNFNSFAKECKLIGDAQFRHTTTSRLKTSVTNLPPEMDSATPISYETRTFRL